jgi:AcrR family transcriptional regulator
MFVNVIMVGHMKSLRESHTEATVEALLRAGRNQFGREGFDAVSLEAIVAEARVTTGAVYHHFSGKKGLFLAVAEAIERELLAVAADVKADDPWLLTHKAFAALIDTCAAPDVQRIIFLDAPRVIGPEAWRAIELKYAYGGMSAMLAQLVERKVLHPYAIELLAPVLLSVLAEASRATSARPDLRDEALHLMRRMLDALRVGEEKGSASILGV